MNYYTLVSTVQLRSACKIGSLQCTSDPCYPYKAGEVVFIFDSGDPQALLEKYGKAITASKKLLLGDKLYLLQIINPTGKIEIDKSQLGWSESKVHFGEIASYQLIIIGYAEVKEKRNGWIELFDLHVYERPKNLDTSILTVEGPNMISENLKKEAAKVWGKYGDAIKKAFNFNGYI